MLSKITNKFSKPIDIQVTLFEFCDLKCAFCSQDHNDTKGMYAIQEKFNYITKMVEQQFEFGKTEPVEISFMGGELFTDAVPDEIFNEYKILLNRLKDWLDSKNLEHNLAFITNLVFKKTDRVLKLYEDLPFLNMYTSYDPTARYNKFFLETFKENVELFKDKIGLVTTILTKPTCLRLLKGDEYFDYLYENFTVHTDYYNPVSSEGGQEFNTTRMNKINDHMSPTDELLQKVFFMLVDNYPNEISIKNFLNRNIQVKNSCMNTGVILSDNSLGRCVFSWKGQEEYAKIKTEVEKENTNKFECLSCEYYTKCPLTCFISTNASDFKTMNYCWLKDIHRYIEENDKSH